MGEALAQREALAVRDRPRPAVPAGFTWRRLGVLTGAAGVLRCVAPEASVRLCSDKSRPP